MVIQCKMRGNLRHQTREIRRRFRREGAAIAVGILGFGRLHRNQLIGGVGIGFFIWDAWNSSHISEIILALFYVGIIGFVLDRIIAGMAQFVTRGTALN